MTCSSWLCFLLILLAAVSAKELPGLPYLYSGFDALKMGSANEISSGDQSKFRLFDLDELSEKTYTFDADGQRQEFLVPRLVQVNDVAIESRQAVESITRTFEQFFTSYFSSFKFDIAIPIPVAGQPLEVALGVHTALRDTYELLKTTYGGVAISTTWWGMYNIQMAPAYVLKFDPLFNQSLSKLVVNPSTEREQTYYNQIISTYGTHYVSSVIVGGVAHMYTFISQQWLQQNSEHYTETQVSIGVNYAGFGVGFGGGGGSVIGTQTEVFLQNSMTKAVFAPPVLSTPSDSLAVIWKTWVKNAAHQPVVVNRTLFSLSSLLTEYPIAVAEHLQATIDYYLINGHLPKLTDISRRRNIEKSVSLIPIPGIDVVGCGYDIMNLESKSCLFDLTYNDSNTWADMYNGMKTYSIPDGYFVQGSRELYSTYDTMFFDSYNEFVKNSVYVSEHDDWGFLGFGSSHERTEIITRLRHIYEYHFRLAWTKRQAIWYKLSLVTFPNLPLSATAEEAFSGLPTVFDPKSINIWKSFFNSYGTHYVVSSAMGGIVWAEDYFESCMITKYSYTWIRQQINHGYWFFSTSQYNEIFTSTMSVDYEQHRISKLLVIGGNTEQTVDSTTFRLKNWMETLKDKQRPITYQLRPIYTLLPKNSSRRKALEEATLYFRLQAVEATNTYINRLATLETPPPVPKMNCAPSKRKRRNAGQFDLTAARAALCPIVGYYGQQCPGAPNNTFQKNKLALSQLPQTLPHGVGMAFDLATGKLLLPALNFTYDGSTTWNDPNTNQVFYIPNEVILTPSTTENSADVNVRIFKTEIELADIWQKSHLTGDYWLGGEFGLVQNISDLYDKYFKDGRIAAINQKTTVLYALQMKSSDQPRSLILNKYAQRALDQLINEMTSDVFRNFIDAWGTHVIVSTRIGGMIEQQISLRECILRDDTLMSSGMTLATLTKDMTEELLSTVPCITHYFYVRRKKLLDRLLGGNINANTTLDWYRTLALDPALLRIDRYIPWYEFLAADTPARTKLEETIVQYINNSAEERQKQAQHVREQRANLLISAQYVVYMKYISGWQLETGVNPRSVTLNPVTTCPTGLGNQDLASRCSIGAQISACALANIDNKWNYTKNVPVCYERNATTSAFRIVARRVHGIITDNRTMQFRNHDAVGEWTYAGCSRIFSNCSSFTTRYDPFWDRQAFLCAGCELTCTTWNPRTCICSCPPFPDAAPYEPYCKK